jgi:hypothetical protein
VAVLVQESGQHGGTASGPVVRDIIKAYYDKKNKANGQTTVEYQHYNFDNKTDPVEDLKAVRDGQPVGQDQPGKTEPTAAAVASIPEPPAKALHR